MSAWSTRWRHTPDTFADDARPGAADCVYCKGCGHPLVGQARRMQSRVPVAVMMCEPCQERHGHALIPTSGSPTYCFRCGGLDEVFLEQDFSPITHRVCPRCIPERAARYRDGNFAAVMRNPAAGV